MHKDRAVFFVAGLFFGALVGYFLFQSISQAPGGSPVGLSAASPALSEEPEPPPLDSEEVARLSRVAEEDPANAEVRLRIGNLYMESGHLQEAIRWFREALQLEPKDLHLRNHLALCLAGMGRFDEAVSEYEAALAMEPSHPQSLLGLGRVLLLGKNDIRGGIEVWQKLVEAAPGSPEAKSIQEELEALKTAHLIQD